MAVTTTNLGVITAYGDAVAAGYTGTKAEWQALMASYATVAEDANEAKDDAVAAKNAAVDAKNAAVQAKDTAVAAKDTATSKATEATTAANTATTKANEASASAQSIAQSASQIQENTDDIDEIKNTLDEVTEATRNLNTSAMGRYGNAVDGKIYDRNNTFYGMKDFIPVTEGTAYTIKFWGIPSASWTYLFVNDSGSVISRAGYSNTTAKTVTAPTGATKLNVFCRSDSEIVIDDDTHLQIEVGAATEYIPPISATDYIIREKVEKGFFIYPVIDSTYDLDTLTKLGAYRYNTSSVPQNAPVQKASRLINVPSDANSGAGWIQIAITSDTVMYIRYRITSNWSDWVELASKAYVDARLSELLITDGERWEV